MKTLCLLGSPRRGGNSDTLADSFLRHARSVGAETEVVALSDLNYSGCVNLFECKSGSDKCGLQDDLAAVLQSIVQSRVLVLASPIYFTQVSGQLKTAIDRMFSFLVPDYPNVSPASRLVGERHVVLVQTQGEGEDRYADVLTNFAPAFNSLGFSEQHLIRAWGVREPDAVKNSPHFLKQTETVASSIYLNSKFHW